MCIMDKEKERMIRNKTSVAITLLLLVAFAISIVAIPAANAVLMPARDTYAFVTANPNPIGVGQEALVVMWLSEPLPSDAFRRGGHQLVITKPDGTTETKGPFVAESTGSTYTTYTPTTAGTYSFQLNFLGEWLNYTGPHPVSRITGTYEIYYKPSSSKKYVLTVQEEPIRHLSESPVPTGYWTRPIFGENQGWASLAGPWLQPAYGRVGFGSYGLAALNLATSAPESSHVMWTRELEFGGIVGGEDSRGYYTGLSYERKYAGIIIQGRLYYSNPAPNTYGWWCVDLRTGEVLYYKNDTRRPNLGQVLRMETPNQHGNIPYLWYTTGTTWAMYDAFTGNWVLDVANVSSGTTYFGANGEILRYNLYTNSTTGTRQLSLWNATRVSGLMTFGYGPNSPLWRPPQGSTLNGNTAYQWVKDVTPVPVLNSTWQPTILRIGEGIILARSQIMTAREEVAVHAAYDISTGTLLWYANRTGLAAYPNFVNIGAMGSGIYCEYIRETLTWNAYDIKTGALKWTHTFDDPWSMYYGCSAIAYGNFYTAHYDGLHCLDVATGNEKWLYEIPAGFETPYGEYPIFTFHDGFTVADGKIYGCTGEHSPNDPLYKGEKLLCVNATDGTPVWNISFWGIPPPISEGYLATQNIYDNRIYGIGKGPSQTTVEAPIAAVTLGSSLVIRGTVTDVSAGTKQKEQLAHFPNGVAAVSDESMSAWMEYVYMQKPFPQDCQGVTVTIDVIDSNDNYRNIGTATSDASGAFGFTWTPDIPGTYRVIATYAGSKSYGSSYDETFFTVDPAPVETPPVETPPDMTGTYVTYATVAIIAAIAIVGALIILMFRKRP